MTSDLILHPLNPRLIRLKDAPFYLGMDKNRFNAEVRPFLTEICIGKQGIAFDRLEMDAWVEQYKHRNGRPSSNRGDLEWDAEKPQGCAKEEKSGISTSRYVDKRFAKALEQATCKKRK